MKDDIYTQHWKTARAAAVRDGLRVIEHGWEQHVIIDEANGLVYRYPRHEAAAAKLDDEVAVLHRLHTRTWPIELPVMREHNAVFSSYTLIVGEAMDADLIARLSASQLREISTGLGSFMAALHGFDKSVIEHKKTRQTTSLWEYYENRIKNAPHLPFYDKANRAFKELSGNLGRVTPVVVHGDLHGLNIIVNESHRLQGVIDLSEMEIGDPHQDFRKLFMTDKRLLEPALAAYNTSGGQKLAADKVILWAYVNEWANLCYFAGTPSHPTYRRALRHLKNWQQL